jgi:2-phospho-L-lactate guanylyltransferase
MAGPPREREVVIVPLKAFSRAKSRLRAAHGELAGELARRLAAGVLEAARPRRRVVVCDDDSVAQFARDLGAEALVTEARSLNGAVADAISRLGDQADRLIVVHGDLLDPTGLGEVAFGPGVTVVTDDRAQGTNVLAIPAGSGFQPAYGPGSADRHQAEARRLGLALTVVTDSPWRFDADEPGDLPPESV